MPAVAVRHERRRQEKRLKRPRLATHPQPARSQQCGAQTRALLMRQGFVLAGVRCYVIHCLPFPVESPVATPVPPPTSEPQAQVHKATLDLLVGHQNQPETDALMQHHHHNNHRKKRSSQGSHSEEA
ncbi:uncharacterized protein LOC109504036 [Harpegnathos saltator]|uniref:uncharacterized protein LOC109504036 n=1 Tax=Harpegnathos saltator TaxID=610380 RepID=UPI000DBED739|nr:uncharacterized protein LOC109504036 [Harpegnathos saltator]